MNEEEKKAIERLERIKKGIIADTKAPNINIRNVATEKVQAVDTVLNLITKLQEKTENQKVTLAVLNEKQKDMNKLINTVKTYKGQFKRQEEVIRQLQKENKQKDKQIDLMAEDWFFKEGYKLQIYIQRNRTDDRIFRKKRIYTQSV